jgi:hypothetical protein
MRMPLLARIIVNPRETMRTILDTRGTRGAILLIYAAFFSSLITEIDVRDLPKALDSLSPPTLAIAVAVLLVVSACVIPLFYGLSWLAMWSGRFVGGTGSYPAVRAAMAWGTAPVIWALLYRLPAIIFWPAASEVFRDDSKRKSAVPIGEAITVAMQSPASSAFYQIAILAGLEALLLALYLIVASNTLAEAQGISSWAGLGNLLMAYVLPIAIILTIMLAAFLSFR